MYKCLSNKPKGASPTQPIGGAQHLGDPSSPFGFFTSRQWRKYRNIPPQKHGGMGKLIDQGNGPQLAPTRAGAMLASPSFSF